MLNLFLLSFILLFNSSLSNKYFNFIPKNLGSLHNSSSFVTFNSRCSKEIDIRLYKNEENFTIFIDKKKINKYLCMDYFLYGSINHFGLIFLPGFKKKFVKTFKYHNYSEDLLDFEFNGLQIFYFNDSIKNNIASVIDTYKLFNSKNLYDYNKEFIKEKMNLDIIENKVFESKFDYKKIKSGDIILANRLDGLDQLIMWGTGSHIGHTAIATWINDELYILESTDRLSFGVPCWDPPYGIIKNKWDKWFRNIKKCNTSISIIRLNDKFNLNFTKSNLFFDKVKGLPYGYNNFIYGWIDTINNNYPDNFNSNLLYVILNFLENKLDLSVYKIFSQGLNKRLNTNYKKIKEIMVHMLNRNIRFNELLNT